MNALRLAMWSGPRNDSTAFVRSWENREDTVVVDEPFYAHCLKVTGLDHPGRAWLGSVTHAFLIRDPWPMPESPGQNLGDFELAATGPPQQDEILDSVVQGGDAVWEGLRLYQGRIFGLEQHLDRLVHSAKALAFAQIPTPGHIIDELRRTLAANGIFDGVHIRLTLTRGVKVTSGMDPRLNQSGPTLSAGLPGPEDLPQQPDAGRARIRRGDERHQPVRRGASRVRTPRTLACPEGYPVVSPPSEGG